MDRGCSNTGDSRCILDGASMRGCIGVCCGITS
jgi:hypothetical protein